MSELKNLNFYRENKGKKDLIPLYNDKLELSHYIELERVLNNEHIKLLNDKVNTLNDSLNALQDKHNKLLERFEQLEKGLNYR